MKLRCLFCQKVDAFIVYYFSVYEKLEGISDWYDPTQYFILSKWRNGKYGKLFDMLKYCTQWSVDGGLDLWYSP